MTRLRPPGLPWGDRDGEVRDGSTRRASSAFLRSVLRSAHLLDVGFFPASFLTPSMPAGKGDPKRAHRLGQSFRAVHERQRIAAGESSSEAPGTA